MKQTKFMLPEKEMPTRWYNILPDLPEPLPPYRHPATKELLPLDMALPPPLFPMEIIKQEFSTERYIEIPEEVQDVYHTWRPTALHRAHRLEKALDTPGPIHGLRFLRSRMQGLHGQCKLPSEALPPHPHGDLGSQYST